MASASSGAPAAADATALLLSDFVPVTINGTATSVDALALPWFERKNGGRGTLVQLRPILELGEPALTTDGPRRTLLNKLGVVGFVQQSVFAKSGAGAIPPIHELHAPLLLVREAPARTPPARARRRCSVTVDRVVGALDAREVASEAITSAEGACRGPEWSGGAGRGWLGSRRPRAPRPRRGEEAASARARAGHRCGHCSHPFRTTKRGRSQHQQPASWGQPQGTLGGIWGREGRHGGVPATFRRLDP